MYTKSLFLPFAHINTHFGHTVLMCCHKYYFSCKKEKIQQTIFVAQDPMSIHKKYYFWHTTFSLFLVCKIWYVHIKYSLCAINSNLCTRNTNLRAHVPLNVNLPNQSTNFVHKILIFDHKILWSLNKMLACARKILFSEHKRLICLLKLLFLVHNMIICAQKMLFTIRNMIICAHSLECFKF